MFNYGATYSEGSTVGNTDGQVREDGNQSVGKGRSRRQVVGDLVDREEQILVRRCANDVCEAPELPRPELTVSEDVGAEYLQGDDEGNNVFGQGLGAAKLRHLWRACQYLVPLMRRNKWHTSG